jgi:hypothetical protein
MTLVNKIHMLFNYISTAIDRIINQVGAMVEKICEVGVKVFVLVILYKIAIGDMLAQILEKF